MSNSYKEDWPLSWKSHLQKNISDFPPSIIFFSPMGLHLEEFVGEISKSFLCSKISNEFSSCGKCQSCLWSSKGSHPDLKIIKPIDNKDNQIEKSFSKGEIKIDQIRQLSGFLNLTAHQNGLRIVCIGPADKLNYPAANALLKSLEEPPHQMHFIIYAHTLRGIPATILSRCRKVYLPVDRTLSYHNQHINNKTLQWLLPLLKLGDNLDPSYCSKKAGKHPPVETLEILIKWMTDVTRVNIGLNSVCFPQEHEILIKINNSLKSLTNWVEATIKIQDMIKYSNHPLNLALFYESIFYEYLNGFN